MKSSRETRRTKEEDLANAAHTRRPAKGQDAVRSTRSAFGDLTNATQKNAANGKKELGKKVKQPADTTAKETRIKPAVPKARVAVGLQAQKKTRKAATTTVTTAASLVAAAAGSKAKATEKKREKVVVNAEVLAPEEPVVTSSQEEADCGNVSIPDVVMDELDASSEDLDHSRMSLDKSIHESIESNQEMMPEVPQGVGVEDIDIHDVDDISLVALYAYDIFEYYKKREEQFMLKPYMAHQPQVTQRMRAVLVDWLVEVQENFELNHETLYLAVQLVDAYLAVVPDIPRDNVQLVGAAALFLSSKFDERLPPAIDDFLYICDHAYNRSQFMAMERELFRTVGFDLGRPISYRFLRRYAKCGKSEVKTLYLARFLLELSLMEYKFVFQRESMIAASCLYIARRMRQEEGWTPTLEYYTGYKLSELKPLVLELNPMLTSKRNSDLTTIRDKYNHYLFHSVGEIPPLINEDLFPEDAPTVEAEVEH